MKYFIDPNSLKKLREAKKLSQAELARKARLQSGRRQIQRLENSTTRTSVRENTLTMLANALGVDTGVLAGEVPAPDPISPSEHSSLVAHPADNYQHKLIALDDGFAIVEFSQQDPVGKMVAKGIQDRAAGLRLADAGTMRTMLLLAEPFLDPDITRGGHDFFGFDTPEEFESFIATVSEFLGKGWHNDEKSSSASVTLSATDSNAGTSASVPGGLP